MPESSKLDDIRRAALTSAEESRRLWVRVITLFAVLEGACWIGYILLAYYGFPLSVLIGVAALLVYSTIFANIMGLRCHLDMCTQRMLKALETLAAEPADER
jgi:hypothetical protein